MNEDTYRRLKQLKEKLRHESFNETITYLLDIATSPRTFLESMAYFLEDMRSDIKELARTMKKLSEILGESK